MFHYCQAIPPLDTYSHMAEFYNPERAGVERGMSLEDKIDSGCVLDGTLVFSEFSPCWNGRRKRTEKSQNMHARNYWLPENIKDDE